ncbi:MAG TPA: hypothetical protein VGL13_15985, partial [Polyangiaceae bacterium]
MRSTTFRIALEARSSRYPRSAFRAAALAGAVLGISLAACGGGSSAAPPPSAPTSTPASAVQPPAASPAPASVPISETARAAAAAPDRSDADKKIDAGRHPAELLSFFHIGPGMKVGELASAGGYTTELLARAVGPTGVVYGENFKW